MKIVITGMNGFVGAAIAKRLYGGEHEITGLVRDKRNVPLEILESYKVIACDIKKEIPPLECDLLINCAADTSLKSMSPLMNKTNVDGLSNVIDSLVKPCNFIHFSCASVYNLGNDPHKENESIQQGLLDSYGRSKLASEQQIMKHLDQLDNVSILRPALIYGTGGKNWIDLFHSIYHRGKINAPGDLKVQVSMLHVESLLDMIENMIADFPEGKQVINLADDQSYEVKDLVETFLNSLYKEKIEVSNNKEPLSRIIAGFHTVMRPGSRLTQSYIDFFTSSHKLDLSHQRNYFGKEIQRNYYDALPEIMEWINNVGLQKILKGNYKIPWL